MQAPQFLTVQQPSIVMKSRLAAGPLGDVADNELAPCSAIPAAYHALCSNGGQI